MEGWMNLYDAGVVFRSSKWRQFWGFRKHRKNTFSMPKYDFPLLLGGRAHQDLLTCWMVGFEISLDRKLRLASLKLTANELKISRSPKGKNHLPTINFQMLSCDSSKHGSLDIHVNWPEKWFLGVIIQGDEFRYFFIGIAIDKPWQVILTRSKATIGRKIGLN